MSPRLCLVILTIGVSLLVCSVSTHGQITDGPRFDPVPLQIPTGTHAATPRPLTNMDLLTMRDIHGLSISPNGRYVAFVLGQADYTLNGYRSGIFIVGTEPGSVPLNLGSAGMPHWDEINQWISEAPQWSSDSRFITYRMRASRCRRWQVWRWSRMGGPPVQLTHAKGDVTSYRWTTNGSEIVMTIEKELDPSEVKKISEHGILYEGNFDAYMAQPIVKAVLASRPKDREIWIHKVATGEDRRATDEEIRLHARPAGDLTALDTGHAEDPKVSPDGLRIAYRQYLDDPRRSTRQSWRLFVKPVVGGPPKDLSPEATYVSDYWWSSDSAELYFVEYMEDGAPVTLMASGRDGGAPRKVFVNLTSDFLASFSMDKSARFLACTRENNTTPARIGYVDLRSGNIRTLFDPNPEFQSFELSPAFRISGKNKFGDSWFGHLVRPLSSEDGKRYPLVITLYRSGDFFLRGASGDENPIQVYAAQGFAVLSFDIGTDRNSVPGDFQTRLSVWASPTASLESAIQRLSEMGIIDPSKVGVAGFSHGAEIMAYAITHAEFIHAAIGDVGSRDPYFYYMATNSWHRIFADWGLGGWPEGSASANWKELAPSLRADRISVPLLMNAADSEFLIDLSVYTSLRELGKPVELYIYANELHRKNQPKHRYEIYAHNLDWFRYWLKGEEDPNVGKKEQYERWGSLRALPK